MTSTALPPIVCATDDRYLPAVTTLMRSLAATQPQPDQLRLIILNQTLSRTAASHVDRLGRQLGLAADLRTVPPAARVAGPVTHWISDAAYLRLTIADVVTDEPRVLYLDSDTLALQDLTPLLQHPLHGAPLGAVQDAQHPTTGAGLLRHCTSYGVPTGREYFNSGVLLLDLDTCRHNDIFGKARQFLTDHPDKARLWDQDALNTAANDQWLRLHRRWNTFALSPLAAQPGFTHHAEPTLPLADLIRDEHRAAILHYAGPAKPWNPEYPTGPLRDLHQRFAHHNPQTAGHSRPDRHRDTSDSSRRSA